MQIAGGKGMTLPAAPTPNQRAEVDQLRALTGAELDRTVLDKLDRWHRYSIKLFEREAKEGADAELKAFPKAPNVLRGMGLEHLAKNGTALKELREKGMAPN